MPQFQLQNPNLGKEDYLYHFGISANDDLKKRFGDVRFVIAGGKASRMKSFAQFIQKELNYPSNCEFEDNGKDLKDISAPAGRYSMFKIGPVISVNHGIGMASLSIVLNEIFKLLHYSECKDVEFIRIGSSGGLGLEPGTLVVTKDAFTPLLENEFSQIKCGKLKKYKSRATAEVYEGILNSAKATKTPATIGNTISADDFFEEQGRLDGAFCDYSEDEKLSFLKKAHDDFGVRNMEMEAVLLTAMCGRAGMACGVVCVTLLNRLLGDGVTSSHDQIVSWEHQLSTVMSHYIKQKSGY